MSAWATEILGVRRSEHQRAGVGVYVCVSVCARLDRGVEAKSPPLVDSLTDDMH